MVFDECFDLIIREKDSKYVWGVLLRIYIYTHILIHMLKGVNRS
jgi:hypothetical protein